MGIFSAKPEDVVAKGGVEKLIKEKKVSHIKVNPIKYELIGTDEKVVSEETKVSKEADIAQKALRQLQEQLAKKKIEPRDKEAEEKREKNKLLNLIDDTLKGETEQSLFVDKLKWSQISELIFRWSLSGGKASVLRKIPQLLKNMRSFGDLRRYTIMAWVYLRLKLRRMLP